MLANVRSCTCCAQLIILSMRLLILIKNMGIWSRLLIRDTWYLFLDTERDSHRLIDDFCMEVVLELLHNYNSEYNLELWLRLQNVYL
jgi:hypothetical protein